MSFTRGARIPASAGRVPYRDPLMRTGVRRRAGLGATNTAAVASTGSVAVGAGTAAVSAIASGAAIGSIVPVVGTAIGAIVGLGVALFAGAGTVDQTKGIWDVVPFSLIRLTGGHGQWTDPLTHATMNDAGSDARKGAVVASSIGAFNDQNNFWYDNVTQQHLSGADTFQRWQQKFGPLNFAQAYAAYPGDFQIFNPTSALGDPSIHAPGAVVPAASTAPSPSASAAPLTASLLGGVSSTTLAVVAGGVLLAVLVRNRRS